MKRIFLLMLLAATAFAAEVKFYVIPTGICAMPGTFLCAGITQGGTLVWMFPSADIQKSGAVYTLTSAFTVTRPDGTTYSGTLTGSVKDSSAQVPLWLGGWAPADTEYVTVTSVTVTADTGHVQVSKAVKNPESAVTY
jgi:hypothetical protein